MYLTVSATFPADDVLSLFGARFGVLSQLQTSKATRQALQLGQTKH
jgi:hypothetical protein